MRPNRQKRTERRGSALLRATLLAALAVACLVPCGCGNDVDTIYGRRKGPGVWASVNGTGVLAKMFQEADHIVFSWMALSPRLRERADCIVWFPDDFQPPKNDFGQEPREDVRNWLEEWLEEKPGRTLIYVGRDFDAAGWYWRRIEPDAPADQEKEVRRRRMEAETDFRGEFRETPDSEDCEWFTVEGKHRPRQVRSLAGKREWLEGIDPARLEIELNGRLVPPPWAEVLLESEGDVLISRQRWPEGSQLIVVTNGSFLVNLALVNHEHRKLAAKLIDEVGPPRQTVVFLESGAGGPPIFDEDPNAGAPTGMKIFHIWPTNWILLHLTVVGILFCFLRFPIFGRPLEPEPERTSDFGKHIEAMGELLERSQDTGYATARLLHYQQQVARPDAGGGRPDAGGGRPDAGGGRPGGDGPRPPGRMTRN